MAFTVLQSSGQTEGLRFDPRTKLLLLIATSTFVMGGLGGEKMTMVLLFFSILPFMLLLTAKRFRSALMYLGVFTAAFLAGEFILAQLSGFLHFFLLACIGILSRILPGVVMGVYVISTTTVSEFTAAMQKLYISDKIIIPISVMFRFFPTVGEEFHSINAAMRMRGIRLGGGNVGKILEYRLVPLLTCTTKIGEELSAAALTRGLGGKIRRTNICRIGFKIQDYLLLALSVAAFVAAALIYAGIL